MGEQCMHVPGLHACNRQRGCAHVQRDSRKPCKPRLLGMKPINVSVSSSRCGCSAYCIPANQTCWLLQSPSCFLPHLFSCQLSLTCTCCLQLGVATPPAPLFSGPLRRDVASRIQNRFKFVQRHQPVGCGAAGRFWWRCQQLPGWCILRGDGHGHR